MPDLRPVILSGGSGTRLWPLSSPELPKQFAPLLGERTLFGMTLARLSGMDGLAQPIVVTGVAHVELVGSELDSAQVRASVLVEPAGRNTAPAVFAAALASAPDDVLVILPSDHIVVDTDGFRDAVTLAAGLAEAGSIVTFGVRPTRPETGYGYLEIGDPVGQDAFTVARFKEKPDREEAEALAGDGRHMWNSGMFVAVAGRVLAEAREHCPQLLEGVRSAMPDEVTGVAVLGDGFADLEPVSFDHAVMERTSRAVVVPIDVGWDDVGSYRSLLAAGERDADGNLISGDVTLSGVRRSFVKATSRRLVVAGLEDMVVVETPDAVLVVHMDRDQEVRDLGQRGQGA